MYVSAKEWKVMSVRDSLRFVIQSTVHLQPTTIFTLKMKQQMSDLFSLAAWALVECPSISDDGEMKHNNFVSVWIIHARVESQACMNVFIKFMLRTSRIHWFDWTTSWNAVAGFRNQILPLRALFEISPSFLKLLEPSAEMNERRWLDAGVDWLGWAKCSVRNNLLDEWSPRSFAVAGHHSFGIVSVFRLIAANGIEALFCWLQLFYILV